MERLWRWCQRHPVTAGLSTAVIVLLGSLAMILWLANQRLRHAASRLESAASTTARQRDAAMETVGALVYRLQDLFDQDEIAVDELQRDALQIAIDGLARMRGIADENPVPGLPAAEAWRKMAGIHARLEQPRDARECLIRAEREFRRLLNSAADRPAALEGLVETLWARHDVELDLAPDSESLEWVHAASQCARELAGEAPDRANRVRLGKALLNEARVTLAVGRDDAAEVAGPLLDEASGLLLEPVSEEPPDRAGWPAWLETVRLQADCREQQDDPAGAARTLETALARLDQDASGPTGPDLPDDAVVMEVALRRQLARLLRESGRTADARAARDRLKRRMETVFSGADRDRTRFESAMAVLRDLAAELDDSEDEDGMLLCAGKRLELARARLQVVPGDEQARLHEAAALVDQANARYLTGAPIREVRKAFDEALALYRELSPRSSFGELDWHDWLEAALSAAECESDSRRGNPAPYVDEARHVRAELASRFPDTLPETLAEADERIAELTGGPADRPPDEEP